MSGRGLIRVCARCGHETSGCPRCGRYDGLLGGLVDNDSFCTSPWVGSEESCYDAVLRERGAARLQKLLDTQWNPALTEEAAGTLRAALEVAEAGVRDAEEWFIELEAKGEAQMGTEQSLAMEVWLQRLEWVRRTLHEFLEAHG